MNNMHEYILASLLTMKDTPFKVFNGIVCAHKDDINDLQKTIIPLSDDEKKDIFNSNTKSLNELGFSEGEINDIRELIKNGEHQEAFLFLTLSKTLKPIEADND